MRAIPEATFHDGDLLLFRRWGFISAAGRSEYSHCGKVGLWHGTPMCVEVREGVGGRAVTVESQVAKYPGRIDLFTANASNRWQGTWNADRAVEEMISFCGQPYGWWHVFLVGLRHAPVVRWFVKPLTSDVHPGCHAPFCSEAIALAAQIGGVDPVPHLAARLTEPADLARSPFYEYQCTLVP